MKPIVKWAGGKTQLLSCIKEKLPAEYNTYYEPFLGGAAVLLDLNPTKAVVNDINPELINMYRQIRNDPAAVELCLSQIDVIHAMMDAKETYYEVRDAFNNDLGTNTITQAARFIYLNKHCFNGLYRVNSKGLFNVPFNGRLKGVSFTPGHFKKVATILQDVDIRCGDYKDMVLEAQSGDLVFFDSPYAPLNPASFVDYTKEGFGYEDHVKLAEIFKELTNRGVYCILTNHDTPLIRELYKDYTIEVVDVRRSINRKGDSRTGTEVIITNY